MKRVNIITFYNAKNHGAFLQAYALMKFLRINGYDVSFKGMKIEHEKVEDEYISQLNSILEESQKLFPLDWSNDDYDISIVGSDEVFNFNNRTYSKFPYFNGSNLDSERIISYAASIGAANYKKLILKHFFKYCNLRKFDAISVRDKRTEAFVKYFYKKNIYVDVDPTLLVNFDSDMIIPKFRNYVLVYTYGMKNEHIQYIKRFAKEKGLEIVATGAYCSWCEKNLAVSPFEWVGLVKYADYIFTSTFHGTIFSLKYQKQFVALVDNAKKVKELLEMFGLSERYCQTINSNEIADLVETKIDYNKLNLDYYIKKSQDHLLGMLGR